MAEPEHRQGQAQGPAPSGGQAGGPGGREVWQTRFGVILAVAGSAVGLGNFLRFPSVAAEWGGGAFMIPYLLAFLVVGLPVALVEWSLGRYGGRHGYNSLAGMFHVVSRNRYVSYLGVLGVLLPVMVYTYYIYVVGWCLGYAYFYATGTMAQMSEPGEFAGFFGSFVGADAHGAAFADPLNSPLIFVVIAFVLNFILIYRGVSKGIEWFCKWAMPTLVIIAIVILVRVLTLGTPNPESPQQNVVNGLGYMWNPVHQADTLAPGDTAVTNLVKRTTGAAGAAIERDGQLTGFKVADEAGFAWALRQSGWSRVADESEAAQGEGPSLSGQWQHDKSEIVLRIRDDAVSLVGAEDGTVPMDALGAPLQQLADWLPRDVASVVKANGESGEDQGFDRLSVRDADEFERALSVVGWQTEEGRWTHESSRLSIELADDRAIVHAPGFWEMLGNPNMWLAAAGQIFFTLSVGFGVIATYASYMRHDDDVMLSGVTAAVGNEFCELVLAGLTILPAGFIFLGASFVANPPGTFGMGFVSLPAVFAAMPLGQVVGFLFFALLFLAAMTSTLSLLQPAIAFLEEGFGLRRRASVTFLGMFTALAAAFVMYCSKGYVALGTIDFWTANVGITVLATVTVIVYGWVLGVHNGMDELRRGAEIKVPRVLGFVIRYVSPLFLLLILVFSFAGDIVDNLTGAFSNLYVGLSFGVVVLALIFFLLLVMQGVRRWHELDPEPQPDPQPDAPESTESQS